MASIITLVWNTACHIALQIVLPLLYRIVRQALRVHRQRNKKSAAMPGAALKREKRTGGDGIVIACMFERLLADAPVAEVEAVDR